MVLTSVSLLGKYCLEQITDVNGRIPRMVMIDSLLPGMMKTTWINLARVWHLTSTRPAIRQSDHPYRMMAPFPKYAWLGTQSQTLRIEAACIHLCSVDTHLEIEP